MKKYLLLLLLLPISTLLISGENDSIYFRSVGLNITELIFNDVKLSYEHQLSMNRGVRISVGYRPARSGEVADNYDLLKLEEDYTAIHYKKSASWYYLGVALQNYKNPGRFALRSTEVFYKHLSATDILYWREIHGTYSTVDNRDMRAHIGGVKMFFGLNSFLKNRSKSKSHLRWELVMGLGARVKFIKTKIYGRDNYHSTSWGLEGIDMYKQPVTERDLYFLPSLHLALKLHYVWYDNHQ